MSSAEKQRVSQLVAATDDELFRVLGVAVSVEEEALSPSPRKAIEAGRAWFENRRKALADTLCRSEAVHAAFVTLKTEGDTIELVLIIAAILTRTTWIVDPVLVATIVVRIGLEGLCADCW